MKIVNHRINNSDDLKKIDKKFGIEIDLRGYSDEVIVSHEPFDTSAENFEKWLLNYNHDLLILNIKEEGIEEKVLKIMDKNNFSNFFLLDQSFPYFIKYLKINNKITSIRFSEFESIETIKSTVNRIGITPGWVWVDCFTGDWNHLSKLNEIKKLGIKTCLVSPELQGRDLLKEINKITEPDFHLDLDAVCTKFPENWQQYV